MKFKPVQDVIVLELEHDKKMTESGLLHLPDVEKDEFDRGGNSGRVVAVGPGLRDKKGNYKPMTVKVGDEVRFNRCEGVLQNHDGKDYIFIREQHALGILEGVT